MLQVNMPGQRLTASTSSSIVSSAPTVTTGPGATLGLAVGQTSAGSPDIAVAPTTTINTTPLTDTSGNSVTASWFSGASGVVAHPLDPVFPLQLYNATVPNQVLRGVGFRGGSFTDSTGKTPLTVAPSTETSVAHPTFFSDVFYPTQVWSANYFDTVDGLNGGLTSLAVAPAQYRSSSPGSTSGTFRQFTNLKFRLYYLSNSALASQITTGAALDSAPNIVGATSTRDLSGNVSFQVRVQNGLLPSGVQDLQDVWVTYNDPSSGVTQWTSVDLTQSASDLSLWTGTASGLSSGTLYMVQAANATGLVSLNTNNGAFFTIAPATPPPAPVTPVLTIQSSTITGTYQSPITFTVSLQSGGLGIPNQAVAVQVGTQAKEVTTGNDGSATVTMPLALSPGTYSVSASYAGGTASGTTYSGTSAQGSDFTVTPAPTTLTLAQSSARTTYSNPTGITAALQSNGIALAQKPVYFTISGNGSTTHMVTITDANGNAALGALALSPGSYSVSVAFADVINNPAVAYTDPYYKGSSASLMIQLVQANVAYTGDTVVPVNTPLNLSASVSSGTNNSLSGINMATVQFVVTDILGNVLATTVALAGTNGIAATTIAGLPTDDVYTISTSVIGAFFTSQAQASLLAVYNPAAGFVTGGGWITSPAGAYSPNPALTGTATFGFVSKYQKGATVPSGHTEFQFDAAGMNFASTSYKWMVIAGSRVQYQGTGTINRTGSYTFMLTAIDGDMNGPQSSSNDKFRIKIMDNNNNGALVYDNQLGAVDTSDPTTTLGGGNIIIHSS
jgi:hypothetical protein